MKGFKKDGLKRLTSNLPKERLAKIEQAAKQEILKIKLAELRKMQNVRQIDIDTFSQSSLSKLEARKDMKISTLIEYIKSIGMDLEIKVFPHRKHSKKDEVILVKA